MQPHPPTPFPGREGGAGILPLSPRERESGGEVIAEEPEPVPTAVAVLDPEPDADLAPAILARLAGWSGPTDCTLPELYRSLSGAGTPPTIGAFHDALRRLYDDGSVALHSWTGPLYALPEPAYALLVGHGVMYYASTRQAASGLATPNPEVQG